MTTTELPPQIEFWDIDKLIDYPKNPKKHSEESIRRRAESMKRFGVTPIQVEGNAPGCTPGMIIAGHGRKKSLLSLGRARAPVIVRDDLTKDECDALRIADNAAVSNEIDYDVLREEAIRLDAEGFDMNVLGMTPAEVGAMLENIGGEIDDSAFVEDVATAVGTQKEENKLTEAAIDGAETPVVEALGFKRVSTVEGRVIRGFMAKIEARTGKTGAAALVDFIQVYSP